jgi:hypothetical protein
VSVNVNAAACAAVADTRSPEQVKAELVELQRAIQEEAKRGVLRFKEPRISSTGIRQTIPMPNTMWQLTFGKGAKISSGFGLGKLRLRFGSGCLQ